MFNPLSFLIVLEIIYVMDFFELFLELKLINSSELDYVQLKFIKINKNSETPNERRTIVLTQKIIANIF